MSATKITGLDSITYVTNTDLIPVVHDPSGSPATNKITVNAFANSVITNYNIVTTHSSNSIVLISNNYVQLQYNANTNASDGDGAGSAWVYVSQQEIGSEIFDTGGNLKAAVYVDQVGQVAIKGNLIVQDSTVPANSSANGLFGQIAWDSNNIYVCVDTNTWKRAALSTW